MQLDNRVIYVACDRQLAQNGLDFGQTTLVHTKGTKSTDRVPSTIEGQSQVTKGHDYFEVANRSCDTCFLVNFGQGI